MRYGFIYETTNLYNGMLYIGQHKRSQNPDDPDDSWYFGSGVRLCESIKNTIEVLGDNWINNYSRRILCECDSKEELDSMEEYYLNLVDAANNERYYNITNKSTEGYPVYQGMKLPDYWKENLRLAALNRKPITDKARENLSIGVKKSWDLDSKRKEILSEKMKGKNNILNNPGVRDKQREAVKKAMNRPDVKAKLLASGDRLRNDEEFKKKISEGRLGELNPCYNKIWITNGIINKRVYEEDFNVVYSLEGYVKGRTVSDETRKKMSSSRRSYLENKGN